MIRYLRVSDVPELQVVDNISGYKGPYRNRIEIQSFDSYAAIPDKYKVSLWGKRYVLKTKFTDGQIYYFIIGTDSKFPRRIRPLAFKAKRPGSTETTTVYIGTSGWTLAWVEILSLGETINWSVAPQKSNGYLTPHLSTNLVDLVSRDPVTSAHHPFGASNHVQEYQVADVMLQGTNGGEPIAPQVLQCTCECEGCWGYFCGISGKGGDSGESFEIDIAGTYGPYFLGGGGGGGAGAITGEQLCTCPGHGGFGHNAFLREHFNSGDSYESGYARVMYKFQSIQIWKYMNDQGQQGSVPGGDPQDRVFPDAFNIRGGGGGGGSGVQYRPAHNGANFEGTEPEFFQLPNYGALNPLEDPRGGNGGAYDLEHGVLCGGPGQIEPRFVPSSAGAAARECKNAIAVLQVYY